MSGPYRFGTITLVDSTVSGNVAQDDGGGIKNDYNGAVTIKNSTVSNNSAASVDLPVAGGGGIANFGSLTLTASTVTDNVANNANGGGVFNAGGILTLSQTLVSGNSAFSNGPEVFNYTGEGSGTVYAYDFNLFGYGGSARVTGFTPEETYIVPSVPLADILAPALASNGGPTRTHALITGSPAIDAVPAAACATTSDQRGIARPQDGNANTIADCDIGAFELQPPSPAPPPHPPPPITCPTATSPAANYARQSRCHDRLSRRGMWGFRHAQHRCSMHH